MIRKIKHWLYNKYLPLYLRESLLQENEKLRKENGKLRESILERDAYIDGLEAGIRAQRRIIINTTDKEVQ